jgi:hypothetical protein
MHGNGISFVFPLQAQLVLTAVTYMFIMDCQQRIAVGGLLGQLCMRVAARQHWVAQCGRQDGGVSPASPAFHAVFSSTAGRVLHLASMRGGVPNPTCHFVTRTCAHSST